MRKNPLAVLCILVACWTGLASAQDVWPSRPVKLVVASSAGGGTDTFARFIAQALTENLKQPFLVDNRPGAGGNIGVDAVAKSAPDGYTFLVSANAQIAINPSLYKNLPYNIERDIAPVARGVTGPLVLCALPSLGVNTLAELVALGKKTPDTLPFGSAGTGTTTYLGVFMLAEAAGVRFLHVPYKGMGAVYKDFLGGQVKFMFPDLASALPHVRSGKAVPLALTERSKLLPNVPTLQEAGFPQVEITNSFSVTAPGGLSPALIDRMSGEIVRAMKSPAFLEKLEAQAMVPVYDTPAAFAVSLKKERDMWASFIQRNKIVLD